METIIRILGSVIFGLAMYSVPVLCVCAYTLGWEDFVKYLLTIAAFGQALLLCEFVYLEAGKQDAD